MARLGHGETIELGAVLDARAEVRDAVARTAAGPLGLAAAKLVDLQAFDFMFPKLQENPKNLLVETRDTRDALIDLGRVMRDTQTDRPSGDGPIPAVYTYFGQFVDHDVTLEAASADVKELLSPLLKPLPLEKIRNELRNVRTATLDLDSVYGPPAPRRGERMAVGKVTPLGGDRLPLRRPPGKDDFNDLPREPRNPDQRHDRAALIGDPRNDENTIVAQLHTAFLRAHNALVDAGNSFDAARRLLRRHYQWLVLHDYLPRIADPKVVKAVLKDGNRFFKPGPGRCFIPLEFSVAAFRFGHSMVRQSYNFNLNFNRGGERGAVPASLGLLFTFTALSGDFDPRPNARPAHQRGTDTLPDNWIAEWERMLQERARRIDTRLVEPLFELTDSTGKRELGDRGRLAVRNLLRGYLLRVPTGQAVAKAVGETPLTPRQIEAAVPPEQAVVLREKLLPDRTPLWFYLLAEAAHHAKGKHLGPVGSLIVAEVFAELVRRSEDSILAEPGWKPSLGATPGKFELADLLRLAGVLPAAGIPFRAIGVPTEAGS